MNLTFKIWRQKNAQDKGKLVAYQLDDISPDMSFLEMLQKRSNPYPGKVRLKPQ